MITYKQLKQFVEKYGNKSELNEKVISGKYDDVKVTLGNYFGIHNLARRNGKSSWCWTWFYTLDNVVTDDSRFWFEERYSMNNGRSYTGWEEAFRAESAIERC